MVPYLNPNWRQWFQNFIHILVNGSKFSSENKSKAPGKLPLPLQGLYFIIISTGAIDADVGKILEPLVVGINLVNVTV